MISLEDRVWDWLATRRELRHYQLLLLIGLSAAATWGALSLPHLALPGTPLACFAVDGRTLECDGEDFRLHGIDVPHMSTFAGMVARVELDGIVAGREVHCETIGKGGAAGLLALCTVDGRDIGELMVRAGVALDCPAQSGGRYAAQERSRAHGTVQRSAECA